MLTKLVLFVNRIFRELMFGEKEIRDFISLVISIKDEFHEVSLIVRFEDHEGTI